jgi:hypothetical protein
VEACPYRFQEEAAKNTCRRPINIIIIVFMASSKQERGV